jgi:ABC-type uncharacterized transport system substrate-binding protein
METDSRIRAGKNLEMQGVMIFLRMTARREKPADLSVGRSTKRALVIRPKTATVLGVTIPQPILIRADEVVR